MSLSPKIVGSARLAARHFCVDSESRSPGQFAPLNDARIGSNGPRGPNKRPAVTAILSLFLSGQLEPRIDEAVPPYPFRPGTGSDPVFAVAALLPQIHFVRL